MLAVSGAWAAEQDSSISPRLGADVYARAERFLSWNADEYARNLDIDHHWIGTSDRFWYARQTRAGKEFVIVDAAGGKTRAAFNHDLLARGLSAAIGRPVDPLKLPFKSLEFLDGDHAVRVWVDKKSWHCSLAQSICTEELAPKSGDLVSPDGRLAAFLKGDDIWVRSTDGRMERPLSRDGEAHYSYGAVAEVSGGQGGGVLQELRVPVAIWSPDSSKLLTLRLDERKVLDLHLLEMVPKEGVRPVLHSYRYAVPGDANEPSAALMIFDVASGKRIDMHHDPLPVTAVDPLLDDRAWWSQDSKTVYAVPREVGEQRVQLLAMDADTGATRTLIEESGKTYVEIGGSAFDRDVRTLTDGRIIWYSERDNWGHLYLYDRAGKLIRQLTSGAWKVMDITRIDERRGRIYFTAVGREEGENPYQQHLYVINLDGSGLRLLTPENANHEVRRDLTELTKQRPPGADVPREPSFSPSGRYFVETLSRPDLPSATVLRTAEGRLIKTLERADISALQASGLTLPEPFQVLAADGTTKLYGMIYRPSRFDPAGKYPVIDVIYPGPQSTVTPRTFKDALFNDDAFNGQALAEVGFVVINIDGRGTPFRSKSFHDVSYGDMAQAGNLEDHIAGIRQLAARYPYMDLDRVGITGHSGGGFASTRAILAYPDFYKVAVSSSGNHDQRGYLLAWGPTYQGPYRGANYDAQINARLAGQLKGKLLLMHGELDNNVHPALTVQLIDALIKAGKDFDFLWLPGQDHSLGATRGYVERKRWNYFVRNLLGMEPPADYSMSEPSK
ncbi:MAG: DPP IV N-terminal domain-containing protein [Proteobacteria bacterium]|nr:DPP IV N-terminal domain-containing protein [Pseudomonadota bacterium]